MTKVKESKESEESRIEPAQVSDFGFRIRRHFWIPWIPSSCVLSFACLFVTFCGFAHVIHFLGMWIVNKPDFWLRCFALLLLFQAPAIAQSSGQAAAAPATIFPDKLLEGMKNFNMAILLQGDIRGNFGPCG